MLPHLKPYTRKLGPAGHNAFPVRMSFPRKRESPLASGGIVQEVIWRKRLEKSGEGVLLSEAELRDLIGFKLRAVEAESAAIQLRSELSATRHLPDGSPEELRARLSDLEAEKRESQNLQATLRTAAAAEVASVKKVSLEETQRLKAKLNEAQIANDALIEQMTSKDAEIALLRKQSGILLGFLKLDDMNG